MLLFSRKLNDVSDFVSYWICKNKGEYYIITFAIDLMTYVEIFFCLLRIWNFYQVLFSFSIVIELCSTIYIFLFLFFLIGLRFFSFISKVLHPMIYFREVFLQKAVTGFVDEMCFWRDYWCSICATLCLKFFKYLIMRIFMLQQNNVHLDWLRIFQKWSSVRIINSVSSSVYIRCKTQSTLKSLFYFLTRQAYESTIIDNKNILSVKRQFFARIHIFHIKSLIILNLSVRISINRIFKKGDIRFIEKYRRWTSF